MAPEDTKYSPRDSQLAVMSYKEQEKNRGAE